MSENDFDHLNDLLKYSTNEVLNLEGFGYRFLRELYAFLEDNVGYSNIQENVFLEIHKAFAGEI
jgi:hypothetical protein